MKYEEMKQALIAAADAAGIAEYEIYSVEQSSQGVETYKHEITGFSSQTGFGICFRCIADGKMGYASTENYTADEAVRIVEAALENAKLIESEDPVYIHAAGDGYGTKTKEASDIPSTEDMIKTALACHEATYAASELVIDGSQSAVSAMEKTVRIYNSKGLDLANRMGYTVAYVSAIVKSGEDMYDGMEIKAAPIEEMKPDEIAGEAVKKARSTIGAGNVKTGKYPVVFDHPAMGSLLATFSGVFSAESAQRGLSLLRGKEGEMIASSHVTLVDDPFCAESAMQTTFDDEGVATKEKKIIEQGVLTTLLHNSKTAAKQGIPSTGNAAKAGYAGRVTIAPYSFYLRAGELSKKEILQAADGGIFVTQVKGLHAGANPVTGDFSLESSGFFIENGELGKPVKSFTIAGNFFELLKKIEAVGNEVKFGMPRGTACFGAPLVLVGDMAVAGE